MSKQRINTLAAVYSLPEIKSKYALVANIKYLLKVQFRDNFKKKKLTQDIDSEYKYLIDGIIEVNEDNNYYFFFLWSKDVN